MAEIKGDEYRRSRDDEDVEGHKRDESEANNRSRDEALGNSRSREDDVEGHKRDDGSTNIGPGHGARESYGSKSRLESDEDDVEGHRMLSREGYEAPTGGDGFGTKSRVSEDDDVEGHSFSTMRSPSSKGE